MTSGLQRKTVLPHDHVQDFVRKTLSELTFCNLQSLLMRLLNTKRLIVICIVCVKLTSVRIKGWIETISSFPVHELLLRCSAHRTECLATNLARHGISREKFFGFMQVIAAELSCRGSHVFLSLQTVIVNNIKQNILK